MCVSNPLQKRQHLLHQLLVKEVRKQLNLAGADDKKSKEILLSGDTLITISWKVPGGSVDRQVFMVAKAVLRPYLLVLCTMHLDLEKNQVTIANPLSFRTSLELSADILTCSPSGPECVWLNVLHYAVVC